MLLSYPSDGLRIYSRLDVPAGPVPAEGYPVLVFVHGWVGREAAPQYDFTPAADSQTAQLIKAYVDNGFVVLTPGLRGHGTVNGVAAEGIEYLDAWDNASYLSPMFYAIDVLNLVAGIPALESMHWPGVEGRPNLRIDQANINILGHSQGADAALTALAVSGEGSALSPALRSGSLWSGCFGPRLEQAAIYGPMASTLQAFMSGDGSWTGTAIGKDGSVNPDFVFGFPPDWIGTVDTTSPDWTWQADAWSVPTVSEALESKFTEMYARLNAGVLDFENEEFALVTTPSGRTLVQHDLRIEQAMAQIGGYGKPQFLTEPIQFHYSDQDYYSPPAWNENLATAINAEGGSAAAFVYPQNNHSLKVSPHAWFSHGEVREGFPMMLRRDLALFLHGNEASQGQLGIGLYEESLSIEALRHYAHELHNEFEVVRELEPLDGMARKELAFTADGLRQYALMIQPQGDRPAGGWPVLLMNHGFHPDPPHYGRVADGSTDRPGDYYRSVPPRFAKQGFLVLVPDYRGHNDSAGAAYTTGPLAPYWYARDVISAFRSIASLPGANAEQVFLWGHSMGGPITLRAALALGDDVRAASIWSSGPAWATTNRYRDQAETDKALGELAVPLRLKDVDAGPVLGQLQAPLVIQHSVADPSTPASGSMAIDAALTDAGLPHEFHLYEGADHLFTGADLELAVDRDLQYFRQRMQVETPRL